MMNLAKEPKVKKHTISTPPYQRPIKVRKSYYQCPHVSDRIQGPLDLLVEVPSIKLEGDWLKEAGFKCKSKAVVTVRKGCLVIKPD